MAKSKARKPVSGSIVENLSQLSEWFRLGSSYKPYKDYT